MTDINHDDQGASDRQTTDSPKASVDQARDRVVEDESPQWIRYVTPEGGGDRSGTDWENAAPFEKLNEIMADCEELRQLETTNENEQANDGQDQDD